MMINALLLAGISLCWASGYLFIGVAAHGLPPLVDTALMSIVAALVLVPGVAYGLKRPLLQPLRTRAWVPLLMGFTAIGWPNWSVVLAEKRIEPEVASLVGTSVPIITFLITVFLTRQTAYSHRGMLGVIVALAGMVIFIGWERLLGGGSELTGILTMASGGLVFALNGILASYKAKDLDECALAAWTVVFGATYLSIVAAIKIIEFVYFQGRMQMSMPSLEVMGAIAIEGLLGMGLATLGYYLLLSRAGAYFTSSYAFLVPPLGVLISSLMLGQPVSSAQLAGLAVVLAGLWMLGSGTARQPAVAEAGHPSVGGGAAS